jgi:hypothetical protein
MKLFGAGGGGFMVAGHHVSYGLLAVLLSVPVAGLAIYQFRSGAIGAAAAPNTGTGTTSVDAYGNILDSNGNVIGTATGAAGAGGGGASDAALAALNGQVGSLTALLQGMSAYSQPAPTGPSYISNSYTTITKAADIPVAAGAAPPAPAAPLAPFLASVGVVLPAGGGQPIITQPNQYNAGFWSPIPSRST